MKWKYQEATISLDEESKDFVVQYGDGSSGNTYKSWSEATAAVDARKQREEKANRVKISVSVIRKVRDGSLSRYVITGIHGGHGGYLSKPSLGTYDSSPLYLDHPAIIAMLERLQEAEKEVGRRRDALDPYMLPNSDWQRRDRNLTTSEGIEAWSCNTTAAADAIVKAKDAA